MNHLHELIIGLLQLKGVGRQKVKLLLEIIDSPQELSCQEIVEIGQAFHLISSQLNPVDLDTAMDQARRLIDDGIKLGISCISYLEDDFPTCFNRHDDPVLVYYRGDLNILNHPRRAAVIGSRTPSQLGADFAYQAGKLLAENNFVVVSGLAVGADYAGHGGALAAGGKTVAFLPSGLSQLYPAVNRHLAEKICDQGGCLVSEYHHHESLLPYKFIERDRLQSAASQFVIVSNFSPGSGTIHTLDYANRYQKPIYSIPVIHDESRAGFEFISKRQIHFEIIENTELRKLIQTD